MGGGGARVGGGGGGGEKIFCGLAIWRCAVGWQFSVSNDVVSLYEYSPWALLLFHLFFFFFFFSK
jgi:hypothetical protein